MASVGCSPGWARSRSATAPRRCYILRATELLEPGHGQDTATTIALGLYVTYNAAATLTSLAAGRVFDRRSARAALVFGVAAFAVAYLGFTRDVSAWWALLPWFLAAGIGIGFVETAEHAAVAGAAPNQLRGSAFGLLAGVQSFGNLAASAIAGLLWTALSPSWAFAYLAAWMSSRSCSSASPGRPPWQRRRPYLRSPAQARAGTPRLSSRARTRWPISSRMGRTASTLCPAGSSSAQSS